MTKVSYILKFYGCLKKLIRTKENIFLEPID